MKLAHMMQMSPDIREKTESLLHEWQQESHTRVGRSSKEALKDLMKDGV